MRTAADVLRMARALVERPELWTQGAYSRDADGVGDPDKVNIVCRCAEGAIMDAYAEDEVAAGTTAWSILQEIVGDQSIPTWNDAPGRTHTEILAAFDLAIGLADAEAQP